MKIKHFIILFIASAGRRVKEIASGFFFEISEAFKSLLTVLWNGIEQIPLQTAPPTVSFEFGDKWHFPFDYYYYYSEPVSCLDSRLRPICEPIPIRWYYWINSLIAFIHIPAAAGFHYEIKMNRISYERMRSLCHFQFILILDKHNIKMTVNDKQHKMCVWHSDSLVKYSLLGGISIENCLFL